MSNIARFEIRVDDKWVVTFTGPAWGVAPETRTLRKLPDNAGGLFPLPPEDDLPPEDAPHYPLCLGLDVKQIESAYRKIRSRQPDPEKVGEAGTTERFGRYLFQTLIGPAVWGRMMDSARAADLIELALSWPKGDHNLHRLNWEMMHGPENFLAAGAGRPVAITRIVSNTASTLVRPLSSPPRVLFVIGTSLTDPSIRPAAESLGLIEQLKGKRSMLARILQRADARRITQEVKCFRPDVVHFICHGQVEQTTGRAYLELVPDALNSNKKRYARDLLTYLRMPARAEDEDDSAEEFARLLAAEPEPVGGEADGASGAASAGGDTYPPIVVLSACYSAGGDPSKSVMMGGFETAPLAAQLVAGGVPIVLGMSGRVSDMACRLFTRRFGEAMVEGEALLAATAEARFTAFAFGAPPQDSADWSFPALFMAEGVSPNYVPTPYSPDEVSVKIESWVTTYNLDRPPVFCARHDFLEDFLSLFPRTERDGRLKIEFSVLAAWVNEKAPGYGRTRLLQTLTAQAIREGHVPILISEEQTDWRKPNSLIELGTRIILAAERARLTFNIGPYTGRYQMNLLKNGLNDLGATIEHPDLDPWIRNILETRGVVSPDAVKRALQRDIGTLISDARKNCDFIRRSGGRVVVLLDEVHEYGDVLKNLFDSEDGSEGLLGPYGLGTASEPVPVVLTFSLTGGGQDACLQPIIQGNKPWLIPRELAAFDASTGEDMLAYERVLLHPNTYGQKTAWKPVAFNERADAEVRSEMDQLFRDMLKGMPALVASPLMEYAARAGLSSKYLKEADDRTALEEARKRQQQLGHL